MNVAGEQFTVHESPAWRDRANFIINAKLPEHGRFEQLWVRQVSDQTFELCCIPFFLYDIALGDIVQTRRLDGREHVLSKVINSSGRYVFRIYLGRSMHPRDEILGPLMELGVLIEWSSINLAAIDTPDEQHAERVSAFLQFEENSGHLVYETGKSA